MDALREALGFLPRPIAEAVEKASLRETISEIRLRQDLPLSVTVSGENRLLDLRGRVCGVRSALRASERDIQSTVFSLCEGSIYRHAQTLQRGFLVTEHGVRAGFATRCLRDESGRARTALSDFVGVNLRIPRAVYGVADELLDFYRREGFSSTLVFSPPGEGKTTLLRDLALSLSVGRLKRPLRVAVIDERGELFPRQSDFAKGGGLLDLLTGHRKAEGIELATRLLSPQIIVCDELGGEDETEALLSAQHSGVLFVASVHAKTREELVRKPNVRALIQGGLFSVFCRLEWDGEAHKSRLSVERAP